MNGAKYEGQWKDDLQDGYGIETWADGSRYEGHYKMGKKHGNGTYTWADGSKYIGNWIDNKISGQVRKREKLISFQHTHTRTK